MLLPIHHFLCDEILNPSLFVYAAAVNLKKHDQEMNRIHQKECEALETAEPVARSGEVGQYYH